MLVSFDEDFVFFETKKTADFDKVECQEQGYQHVVWFGAMDVYEMKRLETFRTEFYVSQNRPYIISTVNDGSVAVSFVRSIDGTDAQSSMYRSGCDRDALDDAVGDIIEKPQRLRSPYI
jgi:hypothetical protein